VARRAGFGNLNLDLIYGLPGQTLSDWQYNLEQALCLAPQHLSLYALSVEDGTPLAQSIANGQLAEPDEDLAADMYDWSEERLEQASFEHYEISNWALPGLESRHNLKYWRREPYLGMGAGSHSCWGNQRYSNVCYPRSYVEHIEVGQSVVEESQCINPLQQQAEAMMLGLRLLEGISCVHFAEQYGRDPRSAYARDIAELQSEGLLALDGDRLHLTRHGHLLANQVFVHFWPPDTDAH
jgi:oxygen-independent coproporphyrinogen-3 oxidase